jgi:tripartite-type tricarboxylate transporter receptor subunit TctC
MVHVAYKGAGAVMPDLLSGRVPMMFENLAVMTPHIRKSSLRPVAVSSAGRTHLMPEVPTVSETGMGLEGFEVLGWFALMAPARTPAQIVQFLNGELNKMIAKPQIVTKFAELGAEPLGGTPERSAGVYPGRAGEMGADHSGGWHQAQLSRKAAMHAPVSALTLVQDYPTTFWCRTTLRP